MESRSYNFSTAKKRSTLLQSKGIEFPRQENNAPRMKIIRKECPNEFQDFLKCQESNPSKLELCVPVREKLFQCGKPGFKKANTDENYIY